MKTKFLLGLFVCLWMMASCADDDPYITLNTSGSSAITLSSEKGAENAFSFSTNEAWLISGEADWLSFSPSAGSSGTNEITLTAKTENRTGESRSATLTIASTSVSQEISVVQSAGRYIRLESDTVQIGLEGGTVEIPFLSNMETDEFDIYRSTEWIAQRIQLSQDGENYTLQLTVYPNLGNQSRTARIYFADAEEGMDGELFNSAYVVQSSWMSENVSTDYSADKTVRVLQKSTVGQGIPVVLMGDGFIDTEIADGYYDEVMDKAFENLFSEEPLRSLQGYFDVYAVTAVSRNSGIGLGETAFSCWMEGGGSTSIDGDEEAIREYAQCVEGIDLNHTLAVVILNSEEYAGTTALYPLMGNFAIAYCPVIYGVDNEMFRLVLNHEAVGHGFGKLADEYYYESYGTIPDSEVAADKEYQALGWFQNIDFTDDASTVLWSAFLADERYASEGLGIFEGGDSYPYGVYRPSEGGMMNDYTWGFNAPSRQSIYKQVMSLGENRDISYEEFTSFDTPQTVSLLRSAQVAETDKGRHFAPPRIVTKRWEKE